MLQNSIEIKFKYIRFGVVFVQLFAQLLSGKQERGSGVVEEGIQERGEAQQSAVVCGWLEWLNSYNKILKFNADDGAVSDFPLVTVNEKGCDATTAR